MGMRKLCFAAFCGVFCFAGWLGAAPLAIGWATRDITGEVPDMIPGQSYSRIAEGVLDPLSVTALAIDNGCDAIILLSADITSWTPPLRSEIARVFTAAKDKIDFNKIIFSATHTHTGGNIWAIPMADCTKDRHRYVKFLAKQCLETALEAWSKRAPGGVAWGLGFAAVGWNRRSLYSDDVSMRPDASMVSRLSDGHVRMYGNTDDPKFIGLESGAEPHVYFLYTFDDKGKLTGAVVNAACPSQCSETLRKYSADYWGDVRRRIREKHGDIPILAQCSAAGDLAPHVRIINRAMARRWRLKYGRAAEWQGEWRRSDIAEEIGDAFDEVLDWAKKDIRRDLVIVNRKIRIDMPKFVPSEAEVAAARRFLAEHPERPKNSGETIADLAARKQADLLVTYHRWARSTIDKAEAAKKDPGATMPCFSSIARLGDIAFASNPYELYLDFAQSLQARSPFEQTFVVQLSLGGEGGYLATERSHANRGYGAVGYSCKVSPEGGWKLVETTLATLRKMNAVEMQAPKQPSTATAPAAPAATPTPATKP